MDVRISSAARQRIVGRSDGSTSRFTLNAITTADELGYAIRYLMDYFTYKASKGHGEINVEASTDAVRAANAAVDSFVAEVPTGDLDEDMVETETVMPVSPLANGQIGNPFAYVGNGVSDED